MSVSVVITAYNNEDIISECIESAAFADEVIVINNQSTDRTAQIAKSMGARVVDHQNNPHKLNESKNDGFLLATSEWIVSLDSDERIETDLQKEIVQVTNVKSDYNGYKIPRHNLIFGKVIQHGLWYPDYQTRLFRKGKGRFPNIHNHEVLEVKGNVGTLKNHIYHLNYHSITQYIQKIDKQYSINEMETFLASGKKVHWYDAIRFPMQDFLTNFFFRKAYKDGLHGLVLSILQAFYMFVVFAKIWEKQGFKEKKFTLADFEREQKKVSTQMKYWIIQEKIEKATGFKRMLFKAILKVLSQK